MNAQKDLIIVSIPAPTLLAHSPAPATVAPH